MLYQVLIRVEVLVHAACATDAERLAREAAQGIPTDDPVIAALVYPFAVTPLPELFVDDSRFPCVPRDRTSILDDRGHVVAMQANLTPAEIEREIQGSTRNSQ